MNENFILAIDTSASPSSVALLKNEQLLSELVIIEQGKTSSYISKKIVDLLQSNNIKPDELQAIAVGIGPGSFTGLRVGMATAKGLAFSLDLPVAPVDSLQALALQFEIDQSKNNKPIIPLIDARKGKVFAGIYQNGEILRKPKRYFLQELSQEFSEQVIYVSPNAEELKPYLASKLVSIISVKNSAYFVGLQAVKTKNKVRLKDLAYLEPNYLINNYI